jgi:hypothetical protein
MHRYGTMLQMKRKIYAINLAEKSVHQCQYIIINSEAVYCLPLAPTEHLRLKCVETCKESDLF